MELMPFGVENGDSKMGFLTSTQKVELEQSLYINSKSFRHLYISRKGFVTGEYIDDTFLYRDRFGDLTTTIICAFCHYDLLMNDDSSISFRQTRDESVLKRIKNTISSTYPSKYSNILLNWAMIITWKDLFFSAIDEEFKNTFQLVLTTDENGQSFALFQYEKLNFQKKIFNLMAGYTFGDKINYVNHINLVEILLTDKKHLPRSVVYPLNCAPSNFFFSTSTNSCGERLFYLIFLIFLFMRYPHTG